MATNPKKNVLEDVLNQADKSGIFPLETVFHTFSSAQELRDAVQHRMDEDEYFKTVSETRLATSKSPVKLLAEMVMKRWADRLEKMNRAETARAAHREKQRADAVVLRQRTVERIQRDLDRLADEAARTPLIELDSQELAHLARMAGNLSTRLRSVATRLEKHELLADDEEVI